MLIDNKQMVSMTDANQNFSKVAKVADTHGTVVILKNNKPKYILVDVDSTGIMDMEGNNVSDVTIQYLSNGKWL